MKELYAKIILRKKTNQEVNIFLLTSNKNKLF